MYGFKDIVNILVDKFSQNSLFSVVIDIQSYDVISVYCDIIQQ